MLEPGGFQGGKAGGSKAETQGLRRENLEDLGTQIKVLGTCPEGSGEPLQVPRQTAP